MICLILLGRNFHCLFHNVDTFDGYMLIKIHVQCIIVLSRPYQVKSSYNIAVSHRPLYPSLPHYDLRSREEPYYLQLSINIKFYQSRINTLRVIVNINVINCDSVFRNFHLLITLYSAVLVILVQCQYETFTLTQSVYYCNLSFFCVMAHATL